MIAKQSGVCVGTYPLEAVEASEQRSAIVGVSSNTTSGSAAVCCGLKRFGFLSRLIEDEKVDIAGNLFSIQQSECRRTA